ncbi:unnamed protein product [Amoebophrya sp. A120]|nr:unnamed protein product [Amoebophrya sp. A120]|eukprot:GSA120T00001266001.1
MTCSCAGFLDAVRRHLSEFLIHIGNEISPDSHDVEPRQEDFNLSSSSLLALASEELHVGPQEDPEARLAPNVPRGATTPDEHVEAPSAPAATQPRPLVEDVESGPAIVSVEVEGVVRDDGAIIPAPSTTTGSYFLDEMLTYVFPINCAKAALADHIRDGVGAALPEDNSNDVEVVPLVFNVFGSTMLVSERSEDGLPYVDIPSYCSTTGRARRVYAEPGDEKEYFLFVWRHVANILLDDLLSDYSEALSATKGAVLIARTLKKKMHGGVPITEESGIEYYSAEEIDGSGEVQNALAYLQLPSQPLVTALHRLNRFIFNPDVLEKRLSPATYAVLRTVLKLVPGAPTPFPRIHPGDIELTLDGASGGRRGPRWYWHYEFDDVDYFQRLMSLRSRYNKATGGPGDAAHGALMRMIQIHPESSVKFGGERGGVHGKIESLILCERFREHVQAADKKLLWREFLRQAIPEKTRDESFFSFCCFQPFECKVQGFLSEEAFYTECLPSSTEGCGGSSSGAAHISSSSSSSSKSSRTSSSASSTNLGQNERTATSPSSTCSVAATSKRSSSKTESSSSTTVGEEEDLLCLICCDKRKEIAVSPCNHWNFCTACFVNLLERRTDVNEDTRKREREAVEGYHVRRGGALTMSKDLQCPLCRVPAKGWLRIFG